MLGDGFAGAFSSIVDYKTGFAVLQFVEEREECVWGAGEIEGQF